jgi:hypothetical protein
MQMRLPQMLKEGGNHEKGMMQQDGSTTIDDKMMIGAHNSQP